MKITFGTNSTASIALPLSLILIINRQWWGKGKIQNIQFHAQFIIYHIWIQISKNYEYQNAKDKAIL